MKSWSASTIQLVWFSQEGIRLVAADFFEEFFGETPDGTQQQRLPNNQSASAATKHVGSRLHHVAVNPQRVDVVVRPEPGGKLPAGLVMEGTEQLLKDMVTRAREVSVPDVNRQALVLTLHNLATSPSDAFRQASERLGILDFDDGLDLSFQVNRRRAMTWNDNVYINRLVKIASEQVHEFEVTPNSVPTGTAAVDVAAMTIDLNIVPTRRTFSNSEQQAIWNELYQEAFRLRSEGKLSALLQ